MSENVVGLFGNPAPTTAVDRIVEILEEALVRAKTGETRGIAVVESFASDVNRISVMTRYEFGHGYALNAGIDVAKHNLMREIVAN